MSMISSNLVQSIKAKLIVTAILFVVAMAAMEIFFIYTRSVTDRANALNDLRDNQYETLVKFEFQVLTMVLAAMDAIIDKDTGEIAPELLEEIGTSKKIIRNALPKVKGLADTNQEKELTQLIVQSYESLEQAISKDLLGSIMNKAGEEIFAELDNRIDTLHGTVNTALTTTMELVHEEKRKAAGQLHNTMSSLTNFRRLFIGSVLLVSGTLIFFITRSILSPISNTKNMIMDIAQGEGDLTKRLFISNDEIGELSSWFNTFVDKLQRIIGNIKTNTSALNNSAMELSTLSISLASGSEKASERSNTVATAAEEMSSNMSAVAAASEQASANINMMASATEEMSATVNEIAGNTSKAKTITEEAVAITNKASQRVDKLGNAAKDISKVTEVITEISEQTNLLALNATIEAARAGEAGKGFAVVANEIKELAKQTSIATLEIKEKITDIQSSTDLTISEIKEISSVINNVNDIVTTIASAVEQQSATTDEISSNAIQAAQGIGEVNENVAQSSSVSGEIAGDISEVSMISSEISESSNKMNSQSSELSKIAGQLSDLANQFKI